MAIAYINATRRRGKRQRGGGIAQPRQGGDTVMATAYRTTQRRRALVICAAASQEKKFCAKIECRNTTNKTRRPCAGNTRNGANHSREKESHDG